MISQVDKDVPLQSAHLRNKFSVHTKVFLGVVEDSLLSGGNVRLN